MINQVFVERGAGVGWAPRVAPCPEQGRSCLNGGCTVRGHVGEEWRAAERADLWKALKSTGLRGLKS